MANRPDKIEKENEQKGILLSLTCHILLVLAFIFAPTIGPPKIIPPAQIIVELPDDLLGGAALGLPNEGRGNDRPSPGQPNPDAGNGGNPDPAPPTPTPITPPPPVRPVITKPQTPSAPRPTQTTEDPTAVALRRQQEAARQKAEEQAYQQRQAEIERQKAEQAARDKFKNRIPSGSGVNGNGTGGGTNGGGGTGTGRGNTNLPGNQGIPEGDPNSDNLTGRFGGPGNTDGFGSRKTTNVPKCEDNSSAEGTVIVEAVIDKQGNVVSTRYYAQGSTTSDPNLIAKARDCAADYKFQAGNTDRVKGRIRFVFKNR